MAIVEKEIDYDCGDCPPELQVLRGCREDSPAPEYWLPFEDTDERVKRCPLAIVPMRAYRAVQLTNLLELGVLPDPGGVLDQANAFIQAANVVAETRRKVKEDGR